MFSMVSLAALPMRERSEGSSRSFKIRSTAFSAQQTMTRLRLRQSRGVSSYAFYFVSGSCKRTSCTISERLHRRANNDQSIVP